jgi:hypothetical protein
MTLDGGIRRIARPSACLCYAGCVIGAENRRRAVRHFLVQTDRLPRQARDTHTDNSATTALVVFGLAAGVDYPKPIVDHATVHKINMGRMKASYDRKLYGQPAAATASHPLAPALRQVGSASEGETDTGTASADMGNGDRKAAPASAAATADGCGPTAAKKSRT